MGWMWLLTVPGYIAAGGDLRRRSTASPRCRTDRALAGDRAAGRAHPGRGVALLFPFGGVPLASLGISQAAGPLLGIVRVGGVILLTWVVFQIGFALGAVARAATPGRPARLAALGGRAAVLSSPLVLALVAPRGTATGATLDIAAVQGGGQQGTQRARRADSAEVTDAPPRGDRRRSARPARPRPRRVAGERRRRRRLRRQRASSPTIAAEAARLGVPFAVGVTEDVAGQPDHFLNAQVVVAPDGAITCRYDKVRRVPFGEYMPLRGLLEALGAPVDLVPDDAIAGTGPAVLDAAATATPRWRR